MSERPKVLPPLELFVDELGRRCVPLASLLHVLRQAQARGVARPFSELLAACEHAAEAPLPGLTPQRADQLGMPQGIPGLELAEPLHDPQLGLVHPGAV